MNCMLQRFLTYCHGKSEWIYRLSESRTCFRGVPRHGFVLSFIFIRVIFLVEKFSAFRNLNSIDIDWGISHVAAQRHQPWVEPASFWPTTSPQPAARVSFSACRGSSSVSQMRNSSMASRLKNIACSKPMQMQRKLKVIALVAVGIFHLHWLASKFQILIRQSFGHLMTQDTIRNDRTVWNFGGLNKLKVSLSPKRCPWTVSGAT